MSREDDRTLATTQRLSVPRSPDIGHLRYRHPKVFIVDDDPDMLELLSAYLSGEGYDIRTHSMASTALEEFARLLPEVALVDLRIPDMDGLELIRRARALSPDSNFIVISGYASVDNLIEAIRGGVNDYMTKPFDSADAVRLVVYNALEKQALERAQKIHQITNEATLNVNEVSCVGEGRGDFMAMVRESFRRILRASAVSSLYFGRKKLHFRLDTLHPLSQKPVEQLFSTSADLFPQVVTFADCETRVDLLEESEELGVKGEFGTVLRFTINGPDGLEVVVNCAHVAPGAFSRAAVGQALGLAGTLETVIRRQRAGATQEAQMIADMMNSLKDGVVVLDQDNLVRYVNREARRILAIPEDKTAEEVTPFLVTLDSTIAQPSSKRSFHTPMHKSVRFVVSGEEHFFELDSTAFYTPNKVPYRMILIRDVTHLIREARAVTELNEQLLSRNTRLEAVNKELDTFAYMASHDLREPFRHIQIFSEYLRKDLMEAKQLEGERDYLLSQILKNGDIANRLLTDLRTLSKMTRMENPFEEVALSGLVEDILERFDTTLHETGGRVYVSPLPVVSCDPIKMREVFHNLIGNALKYTDSEEPTISIDGEEFADEVKVWVRDNGIGIDPEYHEYIFEACRRIPYKKASGSGLGLAIVKKVIEEHGGKIGVESTPGEGAAFWFTIPRGLGTNK